jgi:transcriptional antiterminator NusG
MGDGVLAGEAAAAAPRARRARASWYAVRAGEGREEALARRLRRALPADVLEDAFAPTRERWFKSGGAWGLRTCALWPGYLVAVGRDGGALAEALASISLYARAAGGAAPEPLPPGARLWLASVMDGARCVRASEGAIEGGELHVTSGPLVGMEGRVARVVRHDRLCVVRADDRPGGAVATQALNVASKS